MKAKLNISGMSCEHCVAHVTQAANSLSGVEKIKVNLKKNEGKVKFDEQETSASAIAEAISKAGYPTEVI